MPVGVLQVRWQAVVALCGVILLVPPCLALNPQTPLLQYGHTAWRSQDGLFAGTPNSVVQTRDGYLRLATEAGLYQFDGVLFRMWNPPQGSKLPAPDIVSLLAAHDGSLYIGTMAGIARWKDGHLTIYKGPATGSVQNMIETENGEIWYARAHTYDGAGRCAR
jgi:ligand-binding sensor domain-containing protein